MKSTLVCASRTGSPVSGNGAGHSRSQVVWLSGLSGAGKSTLAARLLRDLEACQVPAWHLDGDDLRDGLCKDLGFSDQDRTENIRRAAELARLLSRQSMVVCSFITPLEQQRELVRDIVGSAHCLQVHLRCTVDECARRDPKGLYKRALAGALPAFTGISSPYEPACAVALEIDTQRLSIEESHLALLRALASRVPQLARLVSTAGAALA